MNLIGLEIMVGNKKKFVGKCGIVPYCREVPDLKNHYVLYREVKYEDVFSHASSSIGVDAAAWSKALELGVEGMVIFCTDNHQLILCSKEKMKQFGFVLDLGERPQLRMGLSRVKIFLNAIKIKMGYTTNCIIAPDVTKESFTEAMESVTQPSLPF